MTGFRLTRPAKQDLKSIARHTEQRWGRDQRNFYVRQIDQHFRRLAQYPEIGQPCDQVRPGLLKFPVGSHLLFYRIDPDSGIRIIRILHQSMDIPGKSFPDSP